MSDSAILQRLSRRIYPERDEAASKSRLEHFATAGAARIRHRLLQPARRMQAIVSEVNRCAERYERLDREGLLAAANALRSPLRREGFKPELVAQSFALTRATAASTIGMRHFDVQLMGGWLLLHGLVAEMETGEGKTLVATLPACTAALAGIPVHVITANDYLVARDTTLLRPVYEALGLTLGMVAGGMPLPQRRAAYACDVTYCSNKEVAFDYLRDRISLGSKPSELQLQLQRLYDGNAGSGKLLLRGLSFAIVDEIDSVLIDEARTPLVISTEARNVEEERIIHEALDLAGALARDRDFAVNATDRLVALTESGRKALDEMARAAGGMWTGALHRERLVTQALTALHRFVRDEHYLVRDGRIQVIDEFTGRIMGDRAWGRGLQQLIEAKEGCAITANRETLARISYQRFFRRYLRLSGMTGTAREAAAELASAYGLSVVRVPTNRPVRRAIFPTRVFSDRDEKWRVVLERVREMHATGRPVLIGTRTVTNSEQASRLLADQAIRHQVLNAKQDQEEAAVIASAGEFGRVTIATNMAGRGTDIRLDERSVLAGGLHVILSEGHDARRIDRQLAGRGARQGDPGSFEAVLAADDDVVRTGEGGPLVGLVYAMACRKGAIANRIALWLYHLAQRRAERLHARVRRGLLSVDEKLDNLLSFSGKSE